MWRKTGYTGCSGIEMISTRALDRWVRGDRSTVRARYNEPNGTFVRDEARCETGSPPHASHRPHLPRQQPAAKIRPPHPQVEDPKERRLIPPWIPGASLEQPVYRARRHIGSWSGGAGGRAMTFARAACTDVPLVTGLGFCETVRVMTSVAALALARGA